jgi:hypothetical protein
MDRKEKCPVCNKPDFLLVTPSGELICRYCRNVEQIVDVFLIEKLSQIEHKDSIKELESKIFLMEDINSFFIAILLYLEDIINNIINTGHYPVGLPYIIVQLQFLQEYLYTNQKKYKINITESVIRNFDNVSWNEIFTDLESILPLANNAMQYNNYERDKNNGGLILAKWDSNSGILLTPKKFFFVTPVQLGKKLLDLHPNSFEFLALECKGYATNILSNNSRVLQAWNTYAQYYTHLVKYAEIQIFNLKTIPDIRNWLISLRVFVRNTEETPGLFHYYNDLRFIEPFMLNLYQKTTCQECEIISKNSFHQESLKLKPQTKTNFLKSMESWMHFFGETARFRKIFYIFDDFTIFSHSILKLYEEMLISQIKIQQEWMGREIQTYRAIDNFEHNIWALGFHINVSFLWDDFKPMKNIEFPTPMGNQEIDVIFTDGKSTEAIECKSEIAITIDRLFGHYRKLSAKKQHLGKYLTTKKIDIKNLRLNLITQVCIFPPESDINVFISETHLFTYLIQKFGLFDWGGGKFFNRFPIYARLGWENLNKLEENPKILENIPHLTSSLLTVGWIDFTDMKVKSKKHPKIWVKIENTSLKELQNVDLPALMLYDKELLNVIDFLILPPYYNEMHTDENCVQESYTYHKTDLGQRFLEIGVKNGVFGYCPECISIPLIPFGFWVKPHHSSAKGLCVKCGCTLEINQFDAVSLPDNEDLINRMESVLKQRFAKIGLTF